MLNTYSPLKFIVKGKIFNGFCMRIQDDFHETYAVVLDGYHSFCVWLDDKTATWRASKNVAVGPDVLDKIIHEISIEAPEN